MCPPNEEHRGTRRRLADHVNLVSPAEPLGLRVFARHFHHGDGRAVAADRRPEKTESFYLVVVNKL